MLPALLMQSSGWMHWVGGAENQQEASNDLKNKTKQHGGLDCCSVNLPVEKWESRAQRDSADGTRWCGSILLQVGALEASDAVVLLPGKLGEAMKTRNTQAREEERPRRCGAPGKRGPGPCICHVSPGYYHTDPKLRFLFSISCSLVFSGSAFLDTFSNVSKAKRLHSSIKHWKTSFSGVVTLSLLA